MVVSPLTVEVTLVKPVVTAVGLHTSLEHDVIVKIVVSISVVVVGIAFVVSSCFEDSDETGTWVTIVVKTPSIVAVVVVQVSMSVVV